MQKTRSLASYLSATHRDRLGSHVGDAPRETRLQGALLFLDVSGFTHITEQFGAAGPEGAERLASAFDVCFGGVFDLILAHGGDVLTFAGDAVLALWLATDASTDALAEAAWRAARCGRETLARFDGHSLGHDNVLKLRGVLSAGDVEVLDVGGFGGRWECLVLGDALDQARNADARAAPGDLVLSPQAAAVRPSLGSNSFSVLDRTSPPDVPIDLVRPCLPRIVVEREGADQRDWIAEFRTATLVFARFVGLETATRGRCLLTHRAVQSAQKVIAEHGGGLHQVLADDKGVRLVAGFGLPMFTQSDDAARAVSAAIELRRTVEGLAVPMAVGVATGRIFCGTFGCEGRAEYAIRGSAVNRAARIMMAAPFIVRCDRETVRAAGSKLAFAPLEPMTLKGIADKVAVFRPVGLSEMHRRGAHPAEEEPLVGRRREFASLVDRVDALRKESKGGLLKIVGDAGIGKSHLLASVATAAVRVGVRVLRSTGDSLESSTAYFAWREVLKQLLLREEPPSATRLREAVATRLDSSPMRSWAPLLSAILPLSWADNDVTSQMDGAARADATDQLVAHLLRREAEQTPLALFLDDAHWIDSRSSALLAAVVRRVPSVLVVVGTRPPADARGASADECLQALSLETIALGPMDPGDVQTLLERQLGMAAVGSDVTGFVHERAEGHPLYSREIAHELADARMLVIEGRKCRLAVGAGRRGASGFPRNLHAVITARIDRLGAQEQLVVKTASVLGRTFTADALGALLELRDPLTLSGSLEQLRQRGVVRSRGEREDAEFEFCHITTQEVAYNLLPFAQRRILHARAAAWLEGARASNLDSFHPVLAYHWAAAEEPRRAVGHLEKAAEQAFRSFSNHEVMALLREALALSVYAPVSVARRASWERMIGEASIKMGEYEQARTHLLESLRLCGRPRPLTPAALTVSLMAEMGRQVLYRYRETQPAFDDGAQEIERLVATNYHLLAEVSLFTHDKLGLLHSTLSSLNCGEHGGAPREVVIGFGEVAYAASMLGLRDVARRYRARSIELAERDGSIATIAFAHQIAAAFGNCVGDWDDVLASCERACILFDRLGDRFRWQTCTAIRGYMHLSRGEIDAADGCFSAAHASASPDGALQVLMWARAGELLCALARGDATLSRISEVEHILEGGLLPAEQVLGLGALAEAYARAGNEPAARGVAERALERMRSSPIATSYTLWSIAGVANVLLAAATSARDTARMARAKEAARILRTAARAMPVVAPRALLAAARVAAVQDDRNSARRHYRAALAAAHGLRMPFERQLADREMAGLAKGYDATVARLFPVNFD